MGWISLYASVGSPTGKNSTRDLKIAQALLNVYLRSKNKPTLKITNTINNATNQAIDEFQSDHMKKVEPDGRIDAGGGTYKALIKVLKNSYTKKAIVAPTFGLVTWDSEGAEGGYFHSRKLHVPNSNSGLTIGRGYDFKQKKQTTVISNLTTAGIDNKYILILKKAVGLFGNTAKQFIIDNDLLDFEISPEVQKKLFKISYDDEAKVVKRICKAKTNVDDYGKVDWDKLNSSIKDIAVDLKFRGDYTSSSRKFIQQSIADNDLDAFKKEIVKESNWTKVPADRFKRRKQFIEKAISKPSKKAA